MNRMHEANRTGWDAVSPVWQARIEQRGMWHRCHLDPALVLDSRELAHLGSVSGRDVCVLGSGDNLVAFALAGMDARVTSVDISQAQLDRAASRAYQSITLDSGTSPFVFFLFHSCMAWMVMTA